MIRTDHQRRRPVRQVWQGKERKEFAAAPRDRLLCRESASGGYVPGHDPFGAACLAIPGISVTEMMKTAHRPVSLYKIAGKRYVSCKNSSARFNGTLIKMKRKAGTV